MKKLYILTLMFGLVIHPAVSGADEADPEKWYTEHYAPLWSGNPAAKVDQITHYYDESIASHSPSGETTTTNSREWLEGVVKYWVADGWVDSELVEVRVDRLNDWAVVFKSQWLDHYENQDDEHSCGWYLANRRDGRWVFTGYTELDCGEHGF